MRRESRAMRTVRAHVVWLVTLSNCCAAMQASPAPEESPREKVAAEDFRALMAGEFAWAVDLYRKLGAAEGNLANRIRSVWPLLSDCSLRSAGPGLG